MCWLTAFLLNSFFIIRATQASISFIRPPSSGSAILYSVLNCFSYNLVSKSVGISYGVGSAPIPWTHFEYIWLDTSHNQPKTTIKISSFYLYILISCGCHRDTLLHRLPTWRNTWSVRKVSDLWPGKRNWLTWSVGHLITLKVVPLGLHTLLPAVPPLLEACLKSLFRNGV